MMNTTLLAIAGSISSLWGIAHIIPTRNVVGGFGELSRDNRRILVMEWIAEGVTLVFIGVLIVAVAFRGDGGETARLVLGLCIGMLFAMAVLSAFTGARTPILPMRLCPVVKSVTAFLVIFGMM